MEKPTSSRDVTSQDVVAAGRLTRGSGGGLALPDSGGTLRQRSRSYREAHESRAVFY
jgi:hypothetical protein